MPGASRGTGRGAALVAALLVLGATLMASNRRASMTSYGCFKYEVFGKVQRVFFRKYTQQKAAELGIVGWVMNTARGTVVGEAQGEAAKLREFRKWLQKTGSPKSKIDRAEFKEERLDLGKEDLTYKDFELRS